MATVNEHVSPEIRAAIDAFLSEEITDGATATLEITPDWFIEDTGDQADRLFRLRSFMLYYFPLTFFAWEPLNDEFFTFLEYSQKGMAWLPGQHGKSSMLKRWISWVLCNDPEVSFIYTEKNEPTALKAARAVRSIMESNDLLNGHFGTFKPEPTSSKPWADRAFTIRQRRGDTDWPSFAAYGAGGGSVLGARCNIILVDDPVTPENSFSEKERDKLAQWYADSVSTSPYPLPIRNERYLKKQFLVGTVFRLDDLYHTVLEKGDHEHLYLRAVQDEISGQVLSPRFAFIDPKELDARAKVMPRYEKLRADIKSGRVNNLYEFMKNRGRASFNRRFQNIAINEEDQWCQPEWIYGGGSSLPGAPPGGYTGCTDSKLTLGEMPFPAEEMEKKAGNYLVVTGCDPQSGSKSKFSKNFALVTLALDLDDPAILYLVDLQTGQYPLQSDVPGKLTQVSLLMEQARKYRAELVIESNAVQVGWQDTVRVEARKMGMTVSVRGHHTGTNKQDVEVGVFSMAPMFENGHLRIPYGTDSDKRRVQALIDEILYYGVHPTSDLVMALWFAWTRITKLAKGRDVSHVQTMPEKPYVNRISNFVAPAHWTEEQKRAALREVGVRVLEEERV